MHFDFPYQPKVFADLETSSCEVHPQQCMGGSNENRWCSMVMLLETQELGAVRAEHELRKEVEELRRDVSSLRVRAENSAPREARMRQADRLEGSIGMFVSKCSCHRTEAKKYGDFQQVQKNEGIFPKRQDFRQHLLLCLLVFYGF